MIGDNYFNNNNNKGSSHPFDESHLQFLANQMTPRGNPEFSANHTNFIGNNLMAPNKSLEAIAGQQRLQFSLGSHACNDGSGPQNRNPVSTGLRLSYDVDEERNSSITSGGASPVFSSLGCDVRREIERQGEEVDRFIRSQEENMSRGLKTLKQKHLASLLGALHKGATKKLQEKEAELANLTRKNQELSENLQQASAQAQAWCNWAKHNESLIESLKNNIRQAIEDSNNRPKEGTGETDFLDGCSSNNLGNSSACRACGGREASVLLMPCRHLCLCRDCGEGSVRVCPVCRAVTTGKFEVYFS